MASGFDISVYLSLSGTATVSSDYTLSTSITITAGNTSGSVTLTSIDDAIVEGNETIIIDISSVTNGTESGTQQQTVTLLDDDGVPSVTLSTGASSLSETGGSTTITATLSATSTQDVTVDLSLSGTATVTSDYTLSTFITITAGNTTGSVTLSSVSDAIDENDETVIIDISSVTNGVESGTQQETVTILDDDAAPLVTLSTGATSISETNGSTDITATLSAVSGLDITIDLALSGTATSGTDYTLAASILIPAGNTSASITLNAINDAINENDETAIVDIASVTNGTESGTQQATVTIIDNIVNGVYNVVNIESSIFPNPTTGTLNVNLQEYATAIRILNDKGIMVKEIDNPVYQNLIDLEELPEGMYMIQIISEKGVSVRKITVRK